ncbi:kinesin light chain [Ilyonectria robusta]
MNPRRTDDRPLCLLALDGGGIRGLSELMVLEEIMNRINHDLQTDDDVLPADFFDLIGGTSTGGLIALLLGRLRRSVPQARQDYARIAERVFSLPRFYNKNTFDGKRLEEEVKRVLGEGRAEERMLDKAGGCKVFVCSIPLQDVKARAGPRLFRTYRVRENASFNCTIWEACRATSAAPSYFEPIKIGYESEEEMFVDGGLGTNNPIELVLEEARRVFPGRKVACVVSIGTGVADAITFPSSPKTSPVKLLNALKNMATESEATAEKIQVRFRHLKDTYFRFNVDRGLQDIGLEEWKELSRVRTYTDGYMKLDVVSEQIDKVVRALLVSKLVDSGTSPAMIQLPQFAPGNVGSSQQPPRTLEWQPALPLPSFLNTTEQLVSHVPAPVREGIWVVPFDRNYDFVGRGNEMEQLFVKIFPWCKEKTCQRTVLEGLGGAGKTQIALEAAFQVREMRPECFVLWVPVVDAATFENAYRQIGRGLQIPGIDDLKTDVKALVKKALDQSGDYWLLIVDNADDEHLLLGGSHLADYLPSSDKGSILFTTRTHEVVSKLAIRKDDVIKVKNMIRSEARTLLSQHLNEDQIGNTESTEELLDCLTDLPLAIRQASAYMDRIGMTTTRYLQHFKDNKAAQLLSRHFSDQRRYDNAQNAITTTWLISFQVIHKDHPLAARYLRFMSFLAEKDIPKNLLHSHDDDELEMDEAIGVLKAYAFVTQRAGAQESYDIHQLVQLAMRSWLSQDQAELDEAVTVLIRHINTIFPNPEHENKDKWTRYLPHSLTILTFCTNSTNKWDQSELVWYAARCNQVLGKFRTAEKLFREVIALQQIADEKHPEVLISKTHLANVLLSRGKYEEAEAMYRKTLGPLKQAFGTNDSNVLASMGNLATTLAMNGKSDEAEMVLRETTDLQKQALGEKHPNTLGTMRTLRANFAAQATHMTNEEAEMTLRDEIAVLKQTVGERCPETLEHLTNLATFLSNQGRNEESETISRELIPLLHQELGREHLTTINHMSNFASCLFKQNKWEEAEVIFRKTIPLLQQELGIEGRVTLKTMSNFTNLLGRQGKWEEAEIIFREIIPILQRELGREHTMVLKDMNQFATCLCHRQKWGEAEVIVREIIPLLQQSLGRENLQVLDCMRSFVPILYAQQKWEEAEALCRETLALHQQVLREEHPTTVGLKMIHDWILSFRYAMMVPGNTRLFTGGESLVVLPESAARSWGAVMGVDVDESVGVAVTLPAMTSASQRTEAGEPEARSNCFGPC